MKMHLTRITAALLTLVLLLTPLSVTAAAQGDVDANGKVNTTDARRVLQYAAGMIDENALDVAAADVDADGKVNTTDARLILQYAADMIPDFNRPQTPAQSNEQAVFALINQYRTENGLPALTYREDVQAAADLRAEEIRTLFSHTRPDGTDCFTVLSDFNVSYYAAGENIAAGHRSPEEVMEAWMNSDGHRANILSSAFTGVAIGVSEQDGVLYWTQLFVG